MLNSSPKINRLFRLSLLSPTDITAQPAERVLHFLELGLLLRSRLRHGVGKNDFLVWKDGHGLGAGQRHPLLVLHPFVVFLADNRRHRLPRSILLVVHIIIVVVVVVAPTFRCQAVQ